MNTTFERQDIGYLLTAYADGQLAPQGVMWVEEQLDRNPDLRAKLKEIRQLQAGLRTAFAGGTPAFVLDLPRRDALLASAANPPRKKIRFTPPVWIGLAASVMAIVYVGMQMTAPLRQSAAYAMHDEVELPPMRVTSIAATPSADFQVDQQQAQDLAQAAPAEAGEARSYNYRKNDAEGLAFREQQRNRGVDDSLERTADRLHAADKPAGGATFGGQAAEPELLAKSQRDAAPRQGAGERKQTTTVTASRMSPAAPAAAAPPAPTTPAPVGASLARTDRGGRPATKESDGKPVATPSAPPAPEPVVQPQEFAKRSAQHGLDDSRQAKAKGAPGQVAPADGYLLLNEPLAYNGTLTVGGQVATKADQPAAQNAAPAKPVAGPQAGKDQAVREVPIALAEVAEADAATPLNQLEVPIEEKLVSEDEKSADVTRGREEAVASSETGATGAFMAVGAGGGADGAFSKRSGGGKRRAMVDEKKSEDARALRDIPNGTDKAGLQRQIAAQAAQLEIAKQRYPKLAGIAMEMSVEVPPSGDAELDDLRRHAIEQHAELAMIKDRFPKIAAEITDENQSASLLQAVVGAVQNNPQGEPDLLMLTLGKGDQVANGTEFIIFRGNDYIVRARAEKTLGDLVACRIIADSWNSRGLQIQQGDQAQNRLGGDDARPAISARSLLVTSSDVDPQQSLAALRASVTLDGTLGLAHSLRLIGGEKIGFSLTTGALGFLERQVQINLRDEAAARGILRAVRSAGLQAQFTGGVVHLDAAIRPLDPADTQGYNLPTFKDLFGTSPMQAIAIDAIQTVAIDADTASYEYAKARIASGQPVDPTTIKPEHFINAMPMDYPPAQGSEAFTLYAEAAPSPFARAGTSWGPRTAVVSIGAVAKPAAADERKPLALTLAIDCSGSMAQAGGLDRIQRGLLAFVEHLRAEDRVSIVAFGDQARVILPATPGNDRAALTNALATLTTGGATNAAEGLGLAYQLAAETAAVGVESRVLLATDGGTVAGADDLLRRVTAFKDRGITLVVVGTGQTYRAGPLQDLATKGDGQHFYVGSDEDAQALFTGKLLPDRLAVLAKDAKLQVTWNPQRVSHARLIGYDQRRLAAKDFRDNSVDAGELSQDTQVTALFEVLLVDGGAGPLGTAAVRYKDMRRDQVRELACPLPGTILQSQPSERLRLLACAAATAEWLQRGWWSNVHLITPQEILSQLGRCPQPIAAELRAMVK